MGDSQRPSGPAPAAPVRSKRAAPPISASINSVSSSQQQQQQPPSNNAPSLMMNQRPEGRTNSSPARSIPYQRQESSESMASTTISNYYNVTDQLNSKFEKVSISSSVVLPDGGASATVSAPSTKSSSSSSLSAVGESRKDGRSRMELTGTEELYQILNGEEEKLISKTVQLSCPHTDTMKNGVLTVTNYRLIFRAGMSMDSFEIPLSNILSIEKVPSTSANRTENSFRLRLLCKDLRKINLVVTKNVEQPSHKSFMESLRQLAFPISFKRQLFAFDYKGSYSADGWNVYDAKSEFRRQGVPNDMWKISRVNEKYELSDTYPSVVAVPFAASDDLLKDVAAFRSRGRIPVLSWIHPVSHATITRSSQPQVGVKSHSKEDQGYIKLIHDANPVCPRLCIMDARPMANAVANRAKGGGYESEENYPSIELVFLNIHNIHVMRESLRKVQELCSPKIEDPNHFYSNLEATHWLLHIKIILAGAVKIVEKVETYKSSVLVHCSDGWDRTAQLTSLSMIMLDPFYRTIRGFEVLVEKEWVSFGHKFAHRIGHGEEKLDSDRSPVFLQFIDCVWQLTQQFDTSFEFNERFLIAILDNLYSCRYGNFLCNFEKEHVEKGIKAKTVSLWSYINSNIDDFRNPFHYEQPKDAPGVNSVLYPLTTHRFLKLWMRYYARWDPSTKQQEPVDERYKQLLFARQRLTELRDNLKREAAMKKPSGKSSTLSSSTASSPLTGSVHV